MVYIHYDTALDTHCCWETARGHLTLVQQLVQCLDTMLGATTGQA